MTTNQLNFDTKRFSLRRKDGSKPSIPVYMWMVLSNNLIPKHEIQEVTQSDLSAK